MSRLHPVWLLIISAGAALLGYLATVGMISAGHGSPVLPMSSAVTLVGVGLIVLALGILVWWDQRRLLKAADESRRRSRAGQPPSYSAPARRLHPLQAARVVAAGQACAYAGALIAGWHGGVLLHLAPAAGAGTPNVTSSLVMMSGGLIWVIIGFVVETLCRIPPDNAAPPQDAETTTDGNEGYAL